MAYLVDSKKCDEINNKDREHVLSFEMDEDYKFKYTPESHFKHVLKSVQRQRCKEDEERIWTSFVKEQEFNNVRFPEKNIHLPMQSVKDLIKENMQDVDRELKRLQEDALPERNKGICNCTLNNKNQNITSVEPNSIRNCSSSQKMSTRNKAAYDSNILIPISQANNVIDFDQDSKTSKKVTKSRTKKSVSNSSIIHKKHYTDQLLHATNHFEEDSDSDTDLSNSRMDTVRVQADPLTIHKLLSMQRKISALLNEISFRLSRIPLPDGNNDLKRRQQQTMEFAIRFSRNYLYNLNRLVTSIHGHIDAASTRTKHYHRSIAFHQDMIKQKLIAAYQLLIQALNAYCKHIPNSIYEGHPTKLQNVLQIVSVLKDICNKVEITANYFCSGDINTTPERDPQDDIDAILSKLKLNLESKDQSASRKHVESTVIPATTSLQNGRQLNKKKNLSSRLSMYSINVPKANQRKNTDLRKKHHTERKCKVMDTKSVHVQHFSMPELLYPSPATHTSSSRDTILIDCTKKMKYLKDDDIKTMMDEVPIDSENDSNLEIQTKHSNATKVEQFEELQKKSFIEVWKSRNAIDKETDAKVKNTLNDDDLVKKVTTITKEHLSTLVPVISDLMTLMTKKTTDSQAQPLSETSMETLVEFLQKYQSPKESDTRAPVTDGVCKYFTTNSLSEIQKRNNNVQLICMSSTDKNCKTRQCDVSCQADETAINVFSGTKATRPNTKHKFELFISKESEQRILAYRNEYRKVCQSKPMYSSNTQNKPWDIVAWISNKLIDELIMEATKELEPVGLIQKLYEMEFQEF